MLLSATSTEAPRSRTNLIVRHLRRNVDDCAVLHAFSVFGEIASCMLMRDIITGESRGTALVRFTTAAAVNAACATMHHTSSILGRKIVVRPAEAVHDAVPAGEARTAMRELFVRNVPQDVTETDLCHLASPFGTVVRVQLRDDTVESVGPERSIAFV
jgi:RNA recognition motif-containing protein